MQMNFEITVFANYTDHILTQDGLTYSSLDYAVILQAVKSGAIEAGATTVRYYLPPESLFHTLAKCVQPNPKGGYLR